MTIEELEDTFPNGFHDSCVLSITRDYERGSCILDLAVDLDDENDQSGRIRLLLKGVSLFIVDPPDVKYPFLYVGRWRASGFPTTQEILPDLGVLRENVPAGSFFYSFFLSNANGFVHLAAKEAELLP